MATTDTCDNCGRSVTIKTDRGEYVTGLAGHRYTGGRVFCEGYSHGESGVCLTRNSDGKTVKLGDE